MMLGARRGEGKVSSPFGITGGRKPLDINLIFIIFKSMVVKNHFDDFFIIVL